MLTRRQLEVMTFIEAFVDQHGHSPPYQDVADALGMASKSGVCKAVDRLVERGYLRRFRKRGQGLDILRRIDDPPPAPVAEPAQETAFGWLDPAARKPGIIVVHVNAQGEEQAVHVFPDMAAAADGLSRMPQV